MKTTNNQMSGEVDSLVKLKSCIDNLKYCSTYRENIVFLDRRQISVSAADFSHSFTSRTACKHAAEARIKKAYDEAVSRIEDCLKPYGKRSFYTDVRKNICKDLDEIRELLQLLSTPETAEITNKMSSYATATPIFSEIDLITRELLSRYHLKKVIDYYASIEYETWDSSDFEYGIWKLIAKGFTRHGFNCFETVCLIESDTKAILNSIQGDFTSKIEDIILAKAVEPLQVLYLQLFDTANRRPA